MENIFSDDCSTLLKNIPVHKGTEKLHVTCMVVCVLYVQVIVIVIVCNCMCQNCSLLIHCVEQNLLLEKTNQQHSEKPKTKANKHHLTSDICYILSQVIP